MIVPEVSRFMARVMAAVRPTWPEYPDVAAATAVFDAWEAQQDQLRAAAEQAQSIDDLPG